ncbi:unnamed protein product [Rotaria socialis]
MEELLGDNTKFKLVDNDPTITNEDQLIRLLSRLKKDNFITEAEYKVAKPSGSRLARLYGLPKLHKENCPLRPVMSAIKTVNYGLGKMLTSRLSHLRQRACLNGNCNKPLEAFMKGYMKIKYPYKGL